MNKIMNKIKYRETANDKIYTPLPVALEMIKMCNIKPTDKVLDCSKGAGVFYNNFPECEKYWCEIDEDVVGNNKRDFFEFNERVDWIIGNPPFSMWNAWLEHTMKLTDKFCYIMNTMNLSKGRLHNILKNGFGITQIKILNIRYWFGCSYIVIFEKHKPSLMTCIENDLFCDICNKSSCKRGKKGYDFNKCSVVKQ